jgi:hypothetical protein
MKTLPNFNDILSNPSRVADLSPVEAGEMLARVAGLQTVLMGRVLSGSNGRSVDNEDRLLSLKEAAKLLGMSEDWVYKNGKRLGLLVKIGGKNKYSYRKIQKYIKHKDS